MSINQLALIRYKTIDECLQNRYRKWTLEDLIEKVSDAIYEYEGISNGVSKRTIQAKLENNIYKSSKKSRNCIQFEGNRLLKGIEYINPLYQAILQKKALLIEYKSFKAKKSQQNIYFPYLLKEYRNRWFMIVMPKKGKTLITMALDRLMRIICMCSQ